MERASAGRAAVSAAGYRFPMESLPRLLFVLGYALLIPSLVVFWYTGGKGKDRTQDYSLWVMGVAMAIILLSAQAYRGEPL